MQKMTQLPLCQKASYYKLKAAHVKEDLVIFPSGGHGWGIGKPDTPTMAWASLFLSWVKTF